MVLKPLLGPLIHDIADPQPRHLHRRGVQLEITKSRRDLANLVVHRLKRVHVHDVQRILGNSNIIVNRSRSLCHVAAAEGYFYSSVLTSKSSLVVSEDSTLGATQTVLNRALTA